MLFHKKEVLNTYSEENFIEARKLLEQSGIRYDMKKVPTEDWRAGSRYHYYLYVRERERDEVYQMFRDELEIFVY